MSALKLTPKMKKDTGEEAILEDVNNLRKRPETKKGVFFIGQIKEGTSMTKGTGWVFIYKGKMMIVTAAHVVMIPQTRKYMWDLRFYCGQHGKTTKKDE